MFHIYLYEGKNIKGEAGEALVREAASAWCQEQGIPLTNPSMLEIKRTEKGKPYFPDLPVRFSISHSGQMWICIMGLDACGIDLQEAKDCDFMKIAARYFSRYEQSLVMKRGLTGFYKIWTRREAFAKYTGQGLFGSPLPSFALEDGSLAPFLLWEGRRVYVRELDLGPEIACAYCNEEEEDEIRIYG
jgi:4'-phosphopantetheinyl transferase